MIVPKQVKHIIFDLGQVFTTIHFNKTVEAFNKLAPNGEISLYSYKTQTPIFDLLETGQISEADFIAQLKELLLPDTTTEDVITAWNALLGETNIDLLNLANQLRPNYQTFILSNTNAIHIAKINQDLQKRNNVASLDPFFDHVYFSHTIQERKPNPEAYNYILEKHNLKPEETLFIDDKIENTEAAQSLNMHSIQLLNQNDLYQILK